MDKILQYRLKSNGIFSIKKDRYPKKQHPNQQEGMDEYIDVVDHGTGNINSVKLYKNTKGVYFKKNGNHYLHDFIKTVGYVPFQIITT